MKVIFKKNSEMKKVSLGYAVNYLLPQGLAVIATKKRLAEMKQRQAVATEQQETKTGDQHQQAERLDGKVVEFKGETVTKKKLATSLKIAKTNVILTKPIRKTGEYPVELKFGGSHAKVKIKVVI